MAQPPAGTPPAVIGTDSGNSGTAPEDQTTPELPGNADPAPRKYNPGHYFAMYRDDRPAAMIQAVKPGVVGVHRRYLWRDLESAPGDYDFSAIEADLVLMADHGMQLVAMIEDKTFLDLLPTPAYLWGHTLPNNAGGYTAKRWSPYVVGRLSALVKALGERFDDHPNFEGVAFQESAMSLAGQVQSANGYTPEAYRDALIEILLGARAALPRSQVFWYMNFLPARQGYIRDIARAIEGHDIAMGGPDVLPDSAPLTQMTYPFYTEFQGRLTLFGSMQFDSYAHLHADTSRSTKYWTMQELFEFARDELHANYVFWTRKTRRNPEDSYDWTDALPVIRHNPVFN